ncbi:CD320 antigen [Sorex araneus]|uniref:CD320 antigen n=1 Tax=Sorex araneus TaxID=42254 RepID=UPI0024338851|nr:CD320 antigen [Sorex araneus]
MARAGARQRTTLGLALRLLLVLELGRQVALNPLPPGSRSLGQAQGSCPPSSFQCRSNGYCVPLTWRCDSDEDCPDGSDEEACRIEPCPQDGPCPQPTGDPCSCDNIRDCPRGGEGRHLNCSYPPCPAGELRCLLGAACIPHTWLCDGHPDCPDASDERSCGNQTSQEGNSTSTVTPEALESSPSVSNSSASPPGDQLTDQPQNPSASWGVAVGAVLIIALAITSLGVYCLGFRRRPPRPWLLLDLKNCLVLLDQKTSLL